MYKVSKTYPPQKQVIKDISLSFFLGAKIGIIGLNGSGKSTLMKIIAGIEKDFNGELAFSPGYTIGHLSQDPQLDPAKTVMGIVQEGAQEIVDLLAEFENINLQFGLPEVYEDADKNGQTDGSSGQTTGKDRLLQMPGIWITNWKGPWMHCAVRMVTPLFQFFQEENAAGSLCADCY